MASENEIMAAVLRQLLVNKLDFQRLADDTGLSSAEAARSRWRRLKAKLEGCDSTDTSPSKTSGNSNLGLGFNEVVERFANATLVTLPNLQRELVVKNENGKRERCMDKNEIEDDDVEKKEKSDIHQEKRGRGRTKRTVVGTKRKAAVREEDGDEEACEYISVDEME
ncbi:hypothetical protein ACEPPN_017731 [Leptodophora sp. 'Broadleaf-Isolate-01']